MNIKIALAMVLAATGTISGAATEIENGRYTEFSQPIRDTRFPKLTMRQSAFKAKTSFPMLVPDDGREYKVIIEEDFSLMTAGAENDPDPNFIEGEYYLIPKKYTHTEGWAGRAVMQAGGAVCLGYWNDPYTGEPMTGQLESPELDLHRDNGKAYLSFRAKLLNESAYDMVNIRWVAETDMLPVTGDVQTVAVNGFKWSDIEVELTDCPSNAVIQIYSDAYELLIDDFKVEQFKNEIEAPTALKWTDFTGDSFTANWTAVENAEYYVFNCFYIRRAGTEDQLPDYKYVARDLKVTDTSYHLSNLNRDKVYYYYVRAMSPNGVLSEESQLVEVLDLTVPANVSVSDVSAEGYLVQWDPVYNAEGYGFQSILDHTAPEDQYYDLLNEHFDAIVNDGSIGEPYVNSIGLYDMDSYGMSRANWVMYEGGVINGAIAFHNYTSSYGGEYYGELVSPIMTIGNSTGDLIIEADFATVDAGVRPYIQIAVPGVVDGKTTWVLGAGGEVKQTIGSDWTHVKLTYKVKPGLVRFSIGCTDGGWLYMDNLRISVNLPKGATQRTLYKYDEIKTGLDAPAYYCTTPDRQAGDHQSFALMAARQRPGSYMIPVYVCSEWTDTYQVPDDLAWSGIDTVEAAVAPAATFTAVAAGNGIEIANPELASLVVINAAGHTVARTSAAQSSLSLAPGLYIVASADGAAQKVIVK